MGVVTTEAARPAPIGFAHRGARARMRDNTLEAFELALELGATGLESDAWVTVDGQVVLDHDGVVGPVWRRRALCTVEREALPPHIPSLAELYERCGADFELSLDVKDAAALTAIVGVARRFGAAGRLWLCYQDWRPMAAWRREAPEVHLVESTNVAWMKEGLAARVSTLAAAGFDAVNMHRSQWDHDRVGEVRAVGLLAFAWDVQQTQELERMVAIGLDGVYSDHVDRMTAVLTGPGRDRPAS